MSALSSAASLSIAATQALPTVGVSLQALAELKLARFTITLRALDTCVLPPFLGSTLRGAFGHALKQAICVMDHRNCGECLIAERCWYPYLFETAAPKHVPQLQGQQNLPHPFILVPPIAGRKQRQMVIQRGEDVVFHLTLLGQGVEAAPYVVFALGEMARMGLGVERARFNLYTVHLLPPTGEATSVYAPATRKLNFPPEANYNLRDYVAPKFSVATNPAQVRLRFVTPTRIRVQGDLQSEINFALLTSQLLRRLAMLMELHAAKPLTVEQSAMRERAAAIQTKEVAVHWWDLERYSNRQHSKLKLGGFVGEIEYEGAGLAEFLPLLHAGELLHIGGGTSFGLGRYELVETGKLAESLTSRESYQNEN